MEEFIAVNLKRFQIILYTFNKRKGMMSMLKKILIIGCALYIGSAPITLRASENSSEAKKVYTLPQLSMEEKEEIIFNEFIKEFNISDKQNVKVYRVPELATPGFRANQTSLVGKSKPVTKDLGWAKNQYPKGVKFPGGGSIYWEDDNTKDVNVSFSINGKIFGVSVSAGKNLREQRDIM